MRTNVFKTNKILQKKNEAVCKYLFVNCLHHVTVNQTDDRELLLADAVYTMGSGMYAFK